MADEPCTSSMKEWKIVCMMMFGYSRRLWRYFMSFMGSSMFYWINIGLGNFFNGQFIYMCIHTLLLIFWQLKQIVTKYMTNHDPN